MAVNIVFSSVLSLEDKLRATELAERFEGHLRPFVQNGRLTYIDVLRAAQGLVFTGEQYRTDLRDREWGELAAELKRLAAKMNPLVELLQNTKKLTFDLKNGIPPLDLGDSLPVKAVSDEFDGVSDNNSGNNGDAGDDRPLPFTLVEALKTKSFEVADIPLKSIDGIDVTECEAVRFSMKTVGQLEPIVVYPTISGDGSRYAVISGNARCNAAQKNGEEMIQARILRVDDESATRLFALLELNPGRPDRYRLAMTLQALLSKMVGSKQGVVQLSASLGISQSKFREYLVLLKLNAQVVAMIDGDPERNIRPASLKEAGYIARLPSDKQFEYAMGLLTVEEKSAKKRARDVHFWRSDICRLSSAVQQIPKRVERILPGLGNIDLKKVGISRKKFEQELRSASKALLALAESLLKSR